MNYAYSAKNNAFYACALKSDYEQSHSWPDDAVKVDDAVYEAFASGIPPGGKRRVAGDDGFPEWEDIPPPTQEECVAGAMTRKERLMSEAAVAIAPLQDAYELETITKAEKSSLIAWKTYRVALNRVDVSTAPDIEWPEQPDI